MCDPCVGLYGRTAVVQSEDPPKPIQEINFDTYLMFHSDYNMDNTALICDIVVNVHDTEQNNKVIKQVGYGVFVCQMNKQKEERDMVSVLQATSRNFASF